MVEGTQEGRKDVCYHVRALIDFANRMGVDIDSFDPYVGVVFFCKNKDCPNFDKEV